MWTSTTAHANPFDDLQVAMTSGAERYMFWGFYDGAAAGGHTWKLRYNLPRPGVWRYRVISSHRQLHGKTGGRITPPSPHNRGVLASRGRALIWENTGEPHYIMAQTAYSVLHANVPWREVLDWVARQGFNQVRVDLTLGGENAGQEDMWLWGDAQPAGFRALQPGPVTEDRRHSAGRTAAWPHLQGWPQGRAAVAAARAQPLPLSPLSGGPLGRLSASAVHGAFRDPRPAGAARRLADGRHGDGVGREFAAAFAAYLRRPLLSLHMRCNDTYHQGSTGDSYYHPGSMGLPADFRGQRWLTYGSLHERWKMEGFGILQHRPHFRIPMYLGEGVYFRAKKLDVNAWPPMTLGSTTASPHSAAMCSPAIWGYSAPSSPA